MGDIKIRPKEMRDDREYELALALTGSGLGDLTANFTPRQQYLGMGS